MPLKNTNYIENMQYVINLLFFIAFVGTVISWINASGNTIGLTIITFSLICILLCEISMFNQMNDYKSQMLNNGTPLLLIIIGLTWYLSLKIMYADNINNMEMPDSWYTFSNVIMAFIMIELIHLFSYILEMIESYKKGNSYKGSNTFISIFITVILYLLIGIEQVIATYYKTDG